MTTTRDSVTMSATYGYDASGMRIRKTVDGVTTRCVHRGAHPLMEVDEAGEVVRHYDYLPGADNPYVVVVRVPGSGYAAYFYRSEAPGHVVGLVNTDGQVAEYRYDPWGKPTYASAPIYQPFRFGGREYDEESGLYYNRARYYDPELGRFVSEDPIGLANAIFPPGSVYPGRLSAPRPAPPTHPDQWTTSSCGPGTRSFSSPSPCSRHPWRRRPLRPSPATATPTPPPS